MEGLLTAFVILSLLLLAAAIYHYVKYLNRKQTIRMRLARWKETDPSGGFTPRIKLYQWLIARADRVSPLGRQFLFPDTSEELAGWLERAGYSADRFRNRFLGMKLLFTGIGTLSGIGGYLLGLPMFQFGLVLLPMAGFFAPVVWVRLSARNRQAKISEEMPNFLDMMSLILQSGASADMSLRLVGPLLQEPLAGEIQKMIGELEFGIERDAAWMRLLQRNTAPDLHKLAGLILQSAKLGTPVAATFRLQAQNLRQIRMERAKEQAGKASPKITIITTVLMAPSVFLLILGVLLLNVFYNSEGLGIDLLLK